MFRELTKILFISNTSDSISQKDFLKSIKLVDLKNQPLTPLLAFKDGFEKDSTYINQFIDYWNSLGCNDKNSYFKNIKTFLAENKSISEQIVSTTIKDSLIKCISSNEESSNILANLSYLFTQDEIANSNTQNQNFLISIIKSNINQEEKIKVFDYFFKNSINLIADEIILDSDNNELILKSLNNLIKIEHIPTTISDKLKILSAKNVTTNKISKIAELILLKTEERADIQNIDVQNIDVQNIDVQNVDVQNVDVQNVDTQNKDEALIKFITNNFIEPGDLWIENKIVYFSKNITVPIINTLLEYNDNERKIIALDIIKINKLFYKEFETNLKKILNTNLTDLHHLSIYALINIEGSNIDLVDDLFFELLSTRAPLFASYEFNDFAKEFCKNAYNLTNSIVLKGFLNTIIS